MRILGWLVLAGVGALAEGASWGLMLKVSSGTNTTDYGFDGEGHTCGDAASLSSLEVTCSTLALYLPSMVAYRCGYQDARFDETFHTTAKDDIRHINDSSILAVGPPLREEECIAGQITEAMQIFRLSVDKDKELKDSFLFKLFDKDLFGYTVLGATILLVFLFILAAETCNKVMRCMTSSKESVASESRPLMTSGDLNAVDTRAGDTIERGIGAHVLTPHERDRLVVSNGPNYGLV